MSKQNRNDKLQTRNSISEFLIFDYLSNGDGVEVHVQDDKLKKFQLPRIPR